MAIGKTQVFIPCLKLPCVVLLIDFGHIRNLNSI